MALYRTVLLEVLSMNQCNWPFVCESGPTDQTCTQCQWLGSSTELNEPKDHLAFQGAQGVPDFA